ncbi:MAG: hypothetical protein ACI4RN_07025 [Oscillospiraceae bacterium]
MKLSIQGNIPENTNLLVKIGEETEIINNMNNTVEFDLPEDKEYCVIFEEPAEKPARNALGIVIFILTILLQGLFNIVMFNTDTRWYKNIKCSTVKAKVYVNLKEDTKMEVCYSYAHFNDDLRYVQAAFTVEQDMKTETENYFNKESFVNAYFGYVKQIVSVAFIVMIVFAYLMYISVKNINGAAICLMAVLIAAIILITALVLRSQYKKMKVLYKDTSEKFNT